MATSGWVPLRDAWEVALYGPNGFYRRERPADHFRTSSHASGLFAAAVTALARQRGLTSVWDIGAGEGELLAQIHAQAPDLDLVGVDLRARPASLPDAVGWQQEPATGCTGLVLANELLDNVPCDVVELDAAGDVRVVEVDAASSQERLGDLASADQRRWTDSWWPLREPGQRAEVGLARESWWLRLRGANPRAVCVAVDYGHLLPDRPWPGSLSSYRQGIQTPVSFDGDHDVTAAVAFDALGAVAGGEPRSQREVLHGLGIRGVRPALSRATDNPAGYLADLSRATEAAELTAVGGLGDLWWLVCPPKSVGRSSAGS